MILKRLAIFFIFTTVLGFYNQSYARAVSLPTPATFGLPDAIAGYQVVTVQTSATIACMEAGRKNVILRSAKPNQDSFLNSKDSLQIQQELTKTGIGSFTYQIIGPDVSDQDIVNIFNDSNPQVRKGPCVKLVSAKNPVMSAALNVASPNPPAFTNFVDQDAALYPSGSQSDNAQSVRLTAPVSGGSLPYNDYFALLNNVYTDQAAFYQVGFVGLNFSTTTMNVDYGYSIGGNSPLGTPLMTYYPGNVYIFTITYTNTVWWMCGQVVNNPATYTCQTDNLPNRGTNLQLNVNTSVFLELSSQTPNWYTAFSVNQFYAQNARIYLNGFPQNWVNGYQSSQGCNNPNAQHNPPVPTSGTLNANGLAIFNLTDVPIQCTP